MGFSIFPGIFTHKRPVVGRSTPSKGFPLRHCDINHIVSYIGDKILTPELFPHHNLHRAPQHPQTKTNKVFVLALVIVQPLLPVQCQSILVSVKFIIKVR